MSPEEPARPRAFIAIGAFFVFGASMAAYAAATLLKPGTLLDRLWALNKTGHAQLASLGKGAGLGFVVLSALLCATSCGWFRRRSWGWILGVTIIAINAAGDLVNLAMGEHLKGAVGAAIAGLLLLYMTRSGVRDYFGASKELRGTPRYRISHFERYYKSAFCRCDHLGHKVMASKPVTQRSTCECTCGEYAREAKLIQSSLVPTRGLRNESVEIAFRFTPFLDVGGDFADFFDLPNGLVGVYLGDVVGKGLPAAMYGALAMGTLRGIHKTGTDTAKVLTLLNERLVQRPLPGRFCSTLYALFNPATRELIFSNAGMPLPLLASGRACRQLGEGGFPSGLLSGATYVRHVVQLEPGDCVLFASDGLHELRNPEEVEFGTAEMDEVWAQCRHKSAVESVNFVFDRQLAFSDGTPPHYDITAVVLKVLA